MEQRVESDEVYAGKLFQVFKDTVRLDNDKLTTREIVRHPGSVGIIPRQSDGRIVLVRQFRYVTGQELWEIPAGTLDKSGEDIPAAARRELAEEAGLKAERWTMLGSAYLAPGYCDELMTFFLAEDLTATEAHAELDESFKVNPFDLHDRFEQDRTGVHYRLAHGHGAGQFEGDVFAVDRMRRPVEQADLDVDQWIAREDALLHGLADALLHRRPEILWDRSAEDLVFPDESGPAWHRRDLDHAMAVQACATRLLLVLLFRAGTACDRLLVGHLRNRQRPLNPVLALHLFQDHVQVHLAHPLQNGLLGDRLVGQGQRRVFVDELHQRGIHLLFIGLVLGADGGAVGLWRIVDGRKPQRMIPAGQGVAGDGNLELADPGDISGHDFCDGLEDLALRIPNGPG